MKVWNEIMWFRVTKYLSQTTFWKILAAIAFLGIVMMLLFAAGILDSKPYTPNSNQKVINPD